MPSQRVTFKGHAGDDLAAKLDLPEGEVKAYALYSHCFTCGKDLRAANRIAEELNKEGIALFRFDFTGLGKSEGDFADTHFSSNVQDLLTAAAHMSYAFEPPKFMIGHSLGGAASIVAAHFIPTIQALATIAAPANATNVLKRFADHVDEIEEFGEAEVELAGGRKFLIKKEFIENARMQDIEDAARNLNKPYLILHSPVDETVNIDHARRLFRAAKHPKSFVSLDKADHLMLNDDKYSKYAGRVLAAWVDQYI